MAFQKAGLFLLAISGILPSVVPSQFPGRKSWWGKKITDDLYVAGRLTELQIKYSLESGFRSIVSLFNFPTRDYIGPDQTDPLPSTPEESILATENGLNFSRVLSISAPPPDSSWISEDTVRNFSDIFSHTPKPVMFHCVSSKGAAFIALLHLLRTSKNDPTAEPKMNATGLFQRAASLGYDYVENNIFKNLVLAIDGSINSTPEAAFAKPDVDLPKWNSGPVEWKIQPLAKNLYMTGQLASNELTLLKAKGYTVLVNLRRGVTSGGVPSQEESILLNIKDGTGTYGDNGKPVRQMRETLEANRIDPVKPTSYISVNSTLNYQSRNSLQFGDAVGYNETLQAQAASDVGLEYHHNPVGGVYRYDLTMWEAYRDSLMEIGRTKTSILFQCRTGYRAAVVGILVYGCIHGVGSGQALELAYTRGYPFNQTQDTSVVRLFKEVLDNRDQHCETRLSTDGNPKVPNEFAPSRSAANTSSIFTIILGFIAMTMVYYK